jgi:LAS superfamily LD-carboxypeptidase LdcB
LNKCFLNIEQITLPLLTNSIFSDHFAAWINHLSISIKNKRMRLSLFLFLLLSIMISNCQPTTDAQVQETLETPTEMMTEAVDTFPELVFTLDYLRGRFDPAKHEDFTKVDPAMTDGDGTYYLRKDAYQAFEAMHKAAAKDSIRLEIISATRNFDRQKSIWEAKWTGARLLEGSEKAPETYPDPKDRALAILRWSSMPGTSRHHWGTDMDINKLNNEYFASGQGLKEYEWLTAHAHEYGFCQPYSPKGEGLRPHGYNEEKWHWSFKPVARQLTRMAATELQDTLINGFKGAETAVQIGVVEKYVLGVSDDCLE